MKAFPYCVAVLTAELPTPFTSVTVTPWIVVASSLRLNGWVYVNVDPYASEVVLLYQAAKMDVTSIVTSGLEIVFPVVGVKWKIADFTSRVFEKPVTVTVNAAVVFAIFAVVI